jgi:hypothetical protein
MPKRLLLWFDIKSGLIGAFVMGSLVGLINSAHGLAPALTAAAKQGAYTFFFAGLIMQHCRWLAARNLQPYAAIALATLWPTLVTIVLVYTLHSFKGTPEPVWSSVPPGVLGCLSFFLVSRQLVMGTEDS